MLIVRFLGRVFPSSFAISVSRLFEAEPMGAPGLGAGGLQAVLASSIKKSSIEVECKVNRCTVEDLTALRIMAVELVRASVDLLAFSTGIGLTVILDQIVYPDGTIADILSQDKVLQTLCSSFRVGGRDFETVLGIVMQDRALMAALNDLTSTMEGPRRVATNCARAIESLAHLISPGTKNRDRTWQNFRESLNLTKEYITPITEYSKGPRHGRFEAQDCDDDVRIRAWTIMNRFLEYRKRGDVALSQSEFPVLR